MPNDNAHAWNYLLPLVLSVSGCVHPFAGHSHAVNFNGILVDGQSGLPMSGLEVEVRAGDRVVYEGKADGDGAIRFAHTFECHHRERFSVEDRRPSSALTVVFNVDAGDYGVLEIPVRLIHGSDEGSLGKLRLIPKEGP